MLDDDLPVGRVLSRRDAMRILGIGSAAALIGCKPGSNAAANGTATASAGGDVLPACVAKPESTEGPYFVDTMLNRADIRTEPATNAMRAGAPLALAFNVQQIAAGRCSPLAGAMVDIWQCDADGVYSGVRDTTVGFTTTDQKWLRGYQVTDAGGIARFMTIYPGWYPGRAVHIHFKIRTPASAVTANQSAWEFTSQLYFDDAFTDRVHSQAPYAAKGRRDRRNDQDGIFRQSGTGLVLNVAEGGNGVYTSTFDIGLDLSDAGVGRRDGRAQGGRPPG